MRYILLCSGALFMYSGARGQTAFECKPTAYPVQNFRKAVEQAQADTKELADLFGGPAADSLKGFLSNGHAVAELKASFAPIPPFYSNKPVQTVLSELREHSTIFNWEGSGGTAATLGRVSSDITKRREAVLQSRDRIVAALGRVVQASDAVGQFFRSATGLLGTAKNDTQSVQETYLNKAFDHLDACL
ncbi:MAG: hypothetical protein JO323_11615, partial [Acidobacteriia bacterium]|nr:hypothetical protein [Terriglobia bacterium]